MSDSNEREKDEKDEKLDSTELPVVDLLKNSSFLIKNYRDIQSKRLKYRLSFFVKASIAIHGSIDNIKKTGVNVPIESNRDVDMINRLVDLKTFATIPVFTAEGGNAVSHLYTIGMWYYWGLPELFIKFDQPIDSENTDFMGVLINIIHDNLFYKYKDKIVNKNTHEIDRINFKKEPSSIYLSLDGFDESIKMKRVDDDDYMDLKAYFMMWFYLYYMEAESNEKNEPKLYPLYRIDLKKEKYPEICKKITDALMTSALSKLNTPDGEIDDKNESNDDTSSVRSELSDILETEEIEEEIKMSEVENLDNNENENN